MDILPIQYLFLKLQGTYRYKQVILSEMMVKSYCHLYKFDCPILLISDFSKSPYLLLVSTIVLKYDASRVNNIIIHMLRK